MPLDQAEANRLLNAALGLAAYTAPTTPMRVRLLSAMGTATVNGTELVNSGGSTYAVQTLTTTTVIPTTATAGAIANSGTVPTITFANLPAITILGIEIIDSTAVTPRRSMYGPLTVSKTVALGDSVAFAASQLALSMA
jgi:hypothetical protein